MMIEQLLHSQLDNVLVDHLLKVFNNDNMWFLQILKTQICFSTLLLVPYIGNSANVSWLLSTSVQWCNLWECVHLYSDILCVAAWPRIYLPYSTDSSGERKADQRKFYQDEVSDHDSFVCSCLGLFVRSHSSSQRNIPLWWPINQIQIWGRNCVN